MGRGWPVALATLPQAEKTAGHAVPQSELWRRKVRETRLVRPTVLHKLRAGPGSAPLCTIPGSAGHGCGER